MKQSYCKNRTYKYLNNFDIVILLDGDDWLAKNNTLSILAYEYDKPENNLIIYSGYHVYYDNKILKTVKGNEYPIDVKNNKSYRTFNGWLFTHLSLDMLGYLKKYQMNILCMKIIGWTDVSRSSRNVFSFRISRKNIKHLNEILYVYNKQNSIKYNSSYYNDYNTRN